LQAILVVLLCHNKMDDVVTFTTPHGISFIIITFIAGVWPSNSSKFSTWWDNSISSWSASTTSILYGTIIRCTIRILGETAAFVSRLWAFTITIARTPWNICGLGSSGSYKSNEGKFHI
jgi:hypothetical protein